MDHKVTVVYGLPEGRTWHSIFEATRFFAYATVILLGITAAILSWLIRRSLHPIRELAQEAEKVDAERWAFQAPASSEQFRELRPLAAAIEKTLARLQRSFEQQRQFTSDAAHELKTDLAIAKSSLQLLAMKRRTVEEYERGLDVGMEDIGRLEATVQKMLALARLEQSPKDPSHESDFAQALQDAITQCQSYANLHGLTFDLLDFPPSTKVKLNAEDALLLCSNVLVNAIQHSPEQAPIAISLTMRNGWTELKIRDHGNGIADKNQPHLFDAFYRGDASRSRNTGGTGLGLSICKAICSRAGGNISIANHPSGGAEVVILLPILVTKSEIN
ncbi:sensor histidine kinase [Terriglobus sp. RCC_193]|uniref:sensor histidine kinase n=1 Tax=Terriglobus sp. RCC_193 TaxID=3239218 RepID=UPI003526AB7A